MKIEKLNENQIRCILEKSDLETRKIELSELTYGSEKARALFDEMMEQAHKEVGFSPENMPLMVEAIPVSPECLVLVITKVGDPSQFESWFSNLAKMLHTDHDSEEEEADEDEMDLPFDVEYDEDDDVDFSDPEDEDGIPGASLMDFLTKKVREMSSDDDKDSRHLSDSVPGTVWYSFSNLDRVMEYARFVKPFYEGESLLYKNNSSGEYFLLLKQNSSGQKDFDRACFLAGEFGLRTDVTYATEDYFREHHKLIIDSRAVNVLAVL